MMCRPLKKIKKINKKLLLICTILELWRNTVSGLLKCRTILFSNSGEFSWTHQELTGGPWLNHFHVYLHYICVSPATILQGSVPARKKLFKRAFLNRRTNYSEIQQPLQLAATWADQSPSMNDSQETSGVLRLWTCLIANCSLTSE